MNDYEKTFRMARRMELDIKLAAQIRCSFLYGWMERCLEDGSELAMYWYFKAVEEAGFLLDRAVILAKKKSHFKDNFLDKEKALEYPITELIYFHKGKSIAWCHCDSTPSLVYFRKTNTAHCFPCGKTFNPIDVLMSRDDMTFVEAVKYLTE